MLIDEYFMKIKFNCYAIVAACTTFETTVQQGTVLKLDFNLSVIF